MKKYLLTVEVQEGELQEIMSELQAAQETIYKCYDRMKNAGVLVVKEEAASGN